MKAFFIINYLIKTCNVKVILIINLNYTFSLIYQFKKAKVLTNKWLHYKFNNKKTFHLKTLLKCD